MLDRENLLKGLWKCRQHKGNEPCSRCALYNADTCDDILAGLTKSGIDKLINILAKDQRKDNKKIGGD